MPYKFTAQRAIAVTAALTISSACAGAYAAEPNHAFPTPPVHDTELKAVTGREGLSQISSSDQTSVVSHNSVSGTSITGAIGFDNQAFQNLNGLAVINANTGNNVSINSSMLVNIVIGPHP